MDDDAFDSKRTAKRIGVEVATLRFWRSRGKGPRFFRAGKLVRYRLRDIDAWIEARMSEPAASPERGIANVVS